MRAHPLGRDAAIIGEVIDDPHHFVQMDTALRRPARRRLADRRAAAARSADAHPVPHPRLQQPDAAAVRRAHRARPRGVGRVRRQRRASPRRRSRCGGPTLVVAPFLKRAIPESVWRAHRCLVVHPGHRRRPRPVGARLGDHGRRADVGRHGAARPTPRWTPATSGRRVDVPDARARPRAASTATRSPRRRWRRCARRSRGSRARRAGPSRSTPRGAGVRGRLRPLMRQADRAIDWHARRHGDGAAQDPRGRRLARRARRAAAACRCRLFDAHAEDALRARGVAGRGDRAARRRDPAARRVDGAVWITHLQARRRRRAGVQAAGGAGCSATGSPACRRCRSRRTPASPARPGATIRYEEEGAVGVPALPVLQRRDGHRAVRARCARRSRARAARPTRVIVLIGGPDFWSNGIHLNLIEAAEQPGRGVVAQHQRDERPRARDRPHRPTS